MSRQIRAVFEDAGARGWLHAIRLDHPAEEVAVDPDVIVPMASVYKLPLLIAFCRQVDRGVLDPRQYLTIDPAGRTPGPTGISRLADPVTMSLRDLAVSMATVSDNAAADALLDLVGLDEVAGVLDQAGLRSTRVRRGTGEHLRELQRQTGTDDPDTALAMLADNDRANPAGVYSAANASASTARDMTSLLHQLWTGRLLSPEQTEFARRTMSSQLFMHRIAAGFPHDSIRVAGKTGTFGALRHEVGVVTLPDDSTFAIAVFTQAARADRKLPRVDSAIATAARLAVDQLR